MIFLSFIIFLKFYHVLCQNPVDPLSFLKKFGYIDSRIANDTTTNGSDASVDISAALRQFQRFVGVKVTGELDDDTVSWMQRPRCGVKDVSNVLHDDMAQPFNVSRISIFFLGLSPEMSGVTIKYKSLVILLTHPNSHDP